jgi:YcxB-like protein
MANDVERAVEPVEPAQRIALNFPERFSWRAVGAVIAEKFGLRGLRIAAMIGLMIAYLAYRGCTSIVCTLLYGFAVLCLVLFVAVMWAAKDALDKFVAKHRDKAWLTVDANGVGGESGNEVFHVPWSQFRRIRERNQMWLMETRQGSWMVVPTRDFTARAWELFRARETPKRK